MRAEEVLRTGARHRGRGGNLERERRGGDDLGEAVHLPWTAAVQEREPVARRRQRRSAADRPDLEPGKADRAVEPALDAAAGSVRHRDRPDYADILASRG